MPDKDPKKTDEKAGAQANTAQLTPEMLLLVNAITNAYETVQRSAAAPQQLADQEAAPPTVFEGTAKNAVDVYNDIVAGLRFKIPPKQLILTAKPISSTSVEIAWSDDTNNADGFRLQRSLDNGTPDFKDIVPLPFNARSYVDATVSPNTKYLYRLAAFNVRGETLSNTVPVQTPA